MTLCPIAVFPTHPQKLQYLLSYQCLVQGTEYRGLIQTLYGLA